MEHKAESQSESSWLDCYETEQGDRWCWKKGLDASQEFESREEAMEAMFMDKLHFSTLDELGS